MSKNWKRGLALLMAAMMLAPSSNLTAWQTALGTAMVAQAAEADKITWNLNGHGSSIEASAGVEGEDADAGKFFVSALPEAPTATGYTFGGWWDSAACTGTEYTAENIGTLDVTGGKTLYAKWTAASYTISYYDQAADDNTEFSGEYASGTTVPETFTYGNGVTLPTPSKTGYGFGGWYTTHNGSTPVSITEETSADVKAYAKWVAKPTITLDTTSITEIIPEAQRTDANAISLVFDSESATWKVASLPKYTRNGYDIDYFYDTNTAVDVGDTLSGSITLKANYTPSVNYETVDLIIPESDAYSVAVAYVDDNLTEIPAPEDGVYSVQKNQDITITVTDAKTGASTDEKVFDKFTINGQAPTETTGTVDSSVLTLKGITADTTVGISMKTALEKTVSVSGSGATVKVTTNGDAKDVDGKAFTSAHTIPSTPDVYITNLADATLMFTVTPDTGKRVTAVTVSTDNGDTPLENAEPTLANGVYSIKIPKTKAGNVTINVTTKNTASHDLVVEAGDNSTVTIYQGVSGKTAIADIEALAKVDAVNGKYSIYDDETAYAVVKATDGYTINTVKYDSVDKLGGAAYEKAAVSIGTISSNGKKLVVDAEKTEYTVSYTQPTLSSPSDTGVYIVTNTIGSTVTAPTTGESGNTIDGVKAKYNTSLSFNAYAIVNDASTLKKIDGAAVVVTAQLGSADVPVTKSGDRFTIEGKYLKGATATLTLTANIVTGKATSATGNITHSVTKGDVTKDVAVSEIKAVKGQTTDLIYKIDWKSITPNPAGGLLDLDDNLKDVVITNESGTTPVALSSSAGNLKDKLTVSTTNLGKATVKVLYNGVVVNTIVVEVAPGIGTKLEATQSNISDVAVQYKMSGDFSLTDYAKAAVTGKKLYFVYVAKNKTQLEDDSKADYKNVVKSDSAVAASEYIEIPLTELSEGYGAAASYDIDIYMIEDDATNPTVADALAANIVSGSKTAASIEADIKAGTLTKVSTSATTKAPVYETKLSFKTGKNTVVSGYNYDDAYPNGIVVATAQYSNATSYRGFNIKSIKQKSKSAEYGFSIDSTNYSVAGLESDFDIFDISEDGTQLILNAVNFVKTVDGQDRYYAVQPGVYELTLEAYAPLSIANPSQAKVTLTILPSPDIDYTEQTLIVRADKTATTKAASVSCKPFVVAGTNSTWNPKATSTIKSITYKFAEDSIFDPNGNPVSANTLGIKCASNGTVTISNSVAVLNNAKFAVEATVTLKDGSVDKYTSDAITIISESTVSLTGLAIVKTDKAGATIAEADMLDAATLKAGIEINDISSYSVVPVSYDEKTKVYTNLASNGLVVITDNSKTAKLETNNVINAYAAGNVTFTAIVNDGSKQKKTVAVKVLKSANKPVMTITDAENNTNTGYTKDFTNKADVNSPLTLVVGVDKNNDFGKNYFESTIKVVGGKVTKKVEGTAKYSYANFTNYYEVLPTAAETVVTLTNKLDKTDVTVYTIKNEKYVDVKPLTFKAANKLNGIDKTNAQTVTIKVTGAKDTIEGAEFIKLSNDSLAYAAYLIDDSTAAGYKKWLAAYNKQVAAQSIISQLGSGYLPIDVKKDSKGKATYTVTLKTDKLTTAIPGGTYALDVATFAGTGAADARTADLTKGEITNKTKVSITVTSVTPSVKIGSTVKINNVKGERANLSITTKNATITSLSFANIKNSKGIRNEFTDYFTVSNDGIVTVLKAGAKGDNLKGVLTYTYVDAAGTSYTKTMNIKMSPKTVAVKDVASITVNGLKNAVSQSVFNKIDAGLNNSFSTSDLSDANIETTVKALVETELASRGYVVTGLYPSAWVTVKKVSANTTIPTTTAIGRVNVIVTVDVATDFYTLEQAKAAGNEALAGEAISASKTRYTRFTVDTTYGKRVKFTTASAAAANVNTELAKLTNAFTGSEAADKTKVLNTAKAAIGEGYTVAFKQDSDKKDIWSNYAAAKLNATGKVKGTLVVTKTDDKTTADCAFDITTANIMSTADAKLLVDSYIATVSAAVTNDTNVSDIVAGAQMALGDQGWRFKVANASGKDALKVTKSTFSTEGSVAGYLTITRKDGINDKAEAADKKSFKMNATIRMTVATLEEAKAAVKAVYDQKEDKVNGIPAYTLNTSAANTAMSTAIAKSATDALAELMVLDSDENLVNNSSRYTAAVKSFKVSTNANGKKVVTCKVVITDNDTYLATVNGSTTHPTATIDYSYTAK